MNLDNWLPDTVTVGTQTGVDADGDPSYGASRKVAARVQQERDRDEEQVVHTHVIYTASAVAVDERIQLAGETIWRRPAKVTATHDKRRSSSLYKVLL